MGITRSSDVSRRLREEYEAASLNPKEVFGYANFGEAFPALNAMTAGIHPNTLTILASRPKVGKSQFASSVPPEIARQAVGTGLYVKIITLETTVKTYQRRMAATAAGIPNPKAIRAGMLSPAQRDAYYRALDWIGELPIEYLSNEGDLDEVEALLFGNSNVTLSKIREFLSKDTFWWLLDHMGLVSDLKGGDTTTKTLNLANDLQRIANQVCAGMVITHLTRDSMGKGVPGIESISGSDQVGKNADVLLLLQRPYFENRNLSPEDIELVKEREPAILVFHSRDEGSGMVFMIWDKVKVGFYEVVLPDGKTPPFPR